MILKTYIQAKKNRFSLKSLSEQNLIPASRTIIQQQRDWSKDGGYFQLEHIDTHEVLYSSIGNISLLSYLLRSWKDVSVCVFQDDVSA